MKRCKILFIILCSVLVTVCIAMIVSINIKFPKAQDMSYTYDNPANLDGVIVRPVECSVARLDDVPELAYKYERFNEEKKKNSRLVLMTISIENTTDKMVDFVSSFVFVAEELNAFNGVNALEPESKHCSLMPGETKEVRLYAYLGASLVNPDKFDKLENSTITLVYSFYPYRKKLVF